MKTTALILTQTYVSPCGVLLLGALNNRLCLCDYVEPASRHERVRLRVAQALGARFEAGSSAVLEQTARQIDDYFASRRQAFDVPLLFVGSDFQKTVWHALLQIPYGSTISYAELARRIGRPTAVRAVANANGANALSIVVPCHRVIGSNGALSGYGGGAQAKQMLLRLEGAR